MVRNKYWLSPAVTTLLVAFAACGGNTRSGGPASDDVSTGSGEGDGSTTAAGGTTTAAGGTTSEPPGGMHVDSCKDTQDCLSGQTCVFGQCISPYECRQSMVTCGEARPECPAGQVPSVENGCWGQCVRNETCAYLDSCIECEESGQLCASVESPEQVEGFGCVEEKSECEEEPTCDCLGPTACRGLACLDVVGGQVVCDTPSPPVNDPPDPGNEPDTGDDHVPGNQGSDPDEYVPSVDLPEELDNAHITSFLGQRGPRCTECTYVECGRDAAVCFAETECSLLMQCLFFCEGREGEALRACRLDCVDGDEGHLETLVAGWECVGTTCCDECDVLCPE